MKTVTAELDRFRLLLMFIFSAQPAELIVQPVKICLTVCPCVNQGGTNHNRYTQRLVIVHAQTTHELWSPL